MLDLLLLDGDLVVTQNGDIALTDSIRQAIRVRLLWFAEEWKYNRDYGVPYLRDILIKNPNIQKIKLILTREIMSVDGVQNVTNMNVSVDKQRRAATVTFTVITGKEIFDEEVVLGG